MVKVEDKIFTTVAGLLAFGEYPELIKQQNKKRKKQEEPKIVKIILIIING